MVRLASSPPPGDPVEIRLDQERCWFASFSVQCKVTAGNRETVSLPMNPTPAELLAVRQQLGQETVESSGLAGALKETEERLGRRLFQAVELLKPFGVTSEDLRWAVARALRRQAIPKPQKEQSELFQEDDPSKGS